MEYPFYYYYAETHMQATTYILLLPSNQSFIL